MKDVWLLNLPKKDEKKFGKHPTQKPLSVLERILQAQQMKATLSLIRSMEVEQPELPAR